MDAIAPPAKVDIDRWPARMRRTFAHFLRNVRGRVSLPSVPVIEARDTQLLRPARMHSRVLAGLTALTLSMGLALPAQAGAPGSAIGLAPLVQEPEVLRVRVQLDASACGDEASAIESRVSGDLEGMFLELSVLPGDEGAPVLELVITPFEDPENPGYDAKLVFVVDGARVEASATSASCALCTHGELATEVSKVSRQGIERARAGDFPLRSEPTPPEEPEPEGPEPEAPEQLPEVDEPKPGALGPLGYTGIAASVLGVGAIGGGAALFAKDEAFVGNGLELKQYRAPGAALIGIGAGALVTGVALIIVDRVRAKKAAAR